jgi:hypothetical protein
MVIENLVGREMRRNPQIQEAGRVYWVVRVPRSEGVDGLVGAAVLGEWHEAFLRDPRGR